MRSWKGREVGAGRFALELGLAACTLCLLVENALLLLLLGHQMDWPRSLVVAKAAVKALAALAGSVWPWPATGVVALAVFGALLWAPRSRGDAREVSHA